MFFICVHFIVCCFKLDGLLLPWLLLVLRKQLQSKIIRVGKLAVVRLLLCFFVEGQSQVSGLVMHKARECMMGDKSWLHGRYRQVLVLLRFGMGISVYLIRRMVSWCIKERNSRSF